MNFYRQTIKNVPPVISVPDEFRGADVEVLILPLDQNGNGQHKDNVERDANGYPIGFFEATAGSIPDFPERDQPQYSDVRDRIE